METPIGVVWDTPVTGWAGEESDWVQKLVLHPPRKNAVIIALLKMTRQPTKHFNEEDFGHTLLKTKGLEPSGS